MLIKSLLQYLLAGLLIYSINGIASESAPVIDAEYETIQCTLPCNTPSKNVWWLLRSPDQVEIRNTDKITEALSPHSEIWKRDPNGKLSYMFLMHDDKRAIEYLFDDLKILGMNPGEQQWQITSQLITDDELSHMKKNDIKTLPYQGFETESYDGEINNAKVNVVWIPKLQIPAKIIYTYPKTTATVQLKQLDTNQSSVLASSNRLRTSKELLSSYQQVYFTDIGDMEQNAEAQVWIAKAIGAPGIHPLHH